MGEREGGEGERKRSPNVPERGPRTSKRQTTARIHNRCKCGAGAVVQCIENALGREAIWRIWGGRGPLVRPCIPPPSLTLRPQQPTSGAVGDERGNGGMRGCEEWNVVPDWRGKRPSNPPSSRSVPPCPSGGYLIDTTLPATLKVTMGTRSSIVAFPPLISCPPSGPSDKVADSKTWSCQRYRFQNKKRAEQWQATTTNQLFVPHTQIKPANLAEESSANGHTHAVLALSPMARWYHPHRSCVSKAPLLRQRDLEPTKTGRCEIVDSLCLCPNNLSKSSREPSPGPLKPKTPYHETQQHPSTSAAQHSPRTYGSERKGRIPTCSAHLQPGSRSN